MKYFKILVLYNNLELFADSNLLRWLGFVFGRIMSLKNKERFLLRTLNLEFKIIIVYEIWSCSSEQIYKTYIGFKKNSYHAVISFSLNFSQLFVMYAVVCSKTLSIITFSVTVHFINMTFGIDKNSIFTLSVCLLEQDTLCLKQVSCTGYIIQNKGCWLLNLFYMLILLSFLLWCYNCFLSFVFFIVCVIFFIFLSFSQGSRLGWALVCSCCLPVCELIECCLSHYFWILLDLSI